MMKKITPLAMLCLFVLLATAQQHPLWKNYTTSTNVRRIMAIGDTVWAATNGGLAAYTLDGTHIKTFTKPDGIASNYVWTMTQDVHGTKWFFDYAGGITKLSGNSFSAEYLDANQYTDAAVDQQGHVWAATNGYNMFYEYDGVNTTKYIATTIGIQEDDVNSVLVDKQNNIWAGLGNRGILKFDRSTWKRYTPYVSINDLAMDTAGGIWATVSNKIYKFIDTGFVIINQPVNASWSSSSFSSITFDKDNNMWLSTNSTKSKGIVKFDGTNWTNYTPYNSNMQDSAITCLTIDKDGNVWVGTNKGKVMRFNGTTFTTHNPSVSGIGSNTLFGRHIPVDKQGNRWVASAKSPAVVSKFDGTNWTVINAPTAADQIGRTTYDISFDTLGRLWLVNHDSSLYRLEGNKWINYYTYPKIETTNFIWPDATGSLWFGANGGVSKLSGDTIINYVAPYGRGVLYNYVAVDKNGLAWIGSSSADTGVITFDGVNWKNYNSRNSNMPKFTPGFVAIDKNDAKWFVGTTTNTSNTLFKYDSVWTGYKLPALNGWDTRASMIFIDKKGLLWIEASASNGDGCVWVHNGKDWACFSKSNSGLPDDAVEAIDFGDDGKVWFATTNNGLAVYEGSVFDLSAEQIADQTVCSGSIVKLGIEVTGGVPPYKYDWNSSNGPLACPTCVAPIDTIQANTTYTVTITDAALITTTATINYVVTTAGTLPQIAFTNTHIDCSHAVDTTIANVTAGVGNYSIQWGDGSSSSGSSPLSHVYNAIGDYTITIKDALQCANVTSNTILNLGVSLNELKLNHPGCSNALNGLISVEATGGTLPYKYKWSNNATTAVVNGLAGGTYAVTATDDHSCSISATYTLTPGSSSIPNVNTKPYHPNCINNGALAASVTKGVAPYSYLWSNGDTLPMATKLGYGAYYVTVTDSVGCTGRGVGFLYSNCNNYITGTVFYGTPGSCSPDSVKAPAPYRYITATAGDGTKYYDRANQFGFYSIIVNDTGTYTVDVSPSTSSDHCGFFTRCDNAAIKFNALGDTIADVNFIESEEQEFNLYVTAASATVPRPGFSYLFDIYYGNDSHNAYTGSSVTITMQYDPQLDLIKCDTAYTSHNEVDHTITWVRNLPNGILGNTYAKHIGMVKFNLPSNATGAGITNSLFIEPSVGDCDTANNYTKLVQRVRNSYDPNYKEVSPETDLTSLDKTLTYTIHFQNTGNDSTQFITLKDTLSPYLDPASVKYLASYPQYTSYDITEKGILTWYFDPCKLVDSITNPEGSQGYIMFSINRKDNIVPGSIISNRASIYFDYNEPILTNTVSNMIAIITGDSDINQSIKAGIYPNPFSENASVWVEGVTGKYDFALLDLTGRTVKQIHSLSANRFEIQKDELPAGIYLYRVTSQSGVASGKVAIQ